MNDGVFFHRSYYESIKNLPKNDQNRMIFAILEYGFNEKAPDLPSKLEPLWILIKPTIDSSQRKHKAQKSNGIKGGRPRKDTENKNPTENPSIKPNEKPNISDIDIDIDMDKDKDIYIYTPAALLSQLSENERRFLEQLAGDKMHYLLISVAAWLNAGHETQSVYNTCMTFIRNSPREFKGKPIEPDINGPDGFHYESDVEFISIGDGYEEAKTTQYKVYNDGRREKV